MMNVKLPARGLRARAMRQGKQRGVALVLALVVLLIITVIGVSGLQTSTLEQRMATNARDFDIAFQAAEVALLAGETEVEDIVPGDLPGFTANAAGRFVPASVGSSQRWESVSWATDDTIPDATFGGTTEAAAQPKFIIEHLTSIVADEDTLNLGNIGDGLGTPTDIFRVTAFGTGGAATTRVLLQSTYGKIVR